MKKIPIKGVIIPDAQQWIYDLFDMPAVSPQLISKQLSDANGDEIEVEINSGGGDVFAGSEIYTAIKDYKGNSIVKIVGIAASAASVVATAGKKVMMSPTAQLMIHNVSTYAGGDYHDMEHTAEVLKNANKTVSNAYRLKSGMAEADLLALMDKETWLSPQKALELKLIDEIMFDTGMQLTAACYNAGMLPPEVIQKCLSNPQMLKSSADFSIQNKFKLLTLMEVKN